MRAQELIHRLAEVDDAAQCDELYRRLCEVADWRLTPALIKVMLNPSIWIDARHAAASILYGQGLAPTGGAQLRLQWKQADALTRSVLWHGLDDTMLEEEMDLLGRVACFYPRYAVEGRDCDGFGVERRGAAWTALITDGGAHRVARLHGVRQLFWNTPHDSAQALVQAVAGDDPFVRQEALFALAEYRSGHAWRILMDNHGAITDARMAAWLDVDSLTDEIQQMMRLSLDKRTRALLLEWIRSIGAESVGGVQDYEDEDEGEDEDEDEDEEGEHGQADMVENRRMNALDAEFLDDPIGTLMRWRTRAHLVPAPARAPWVAEFLRSEDPNLRMEAVSWLRSWNEWYALGSLVDDWAARGPAVAALLHMPVGSGSKELAQRALDILTREPHSLAGFRSSAVDLLVKHSPSDVAVHHLHALRASGYLSIRCRAMQLLCERGQILSVTPVWFPGPGDSLDEVELWLNCCIKYRNSCLPDVRTWDLDHLGVKRQLLQGVVAGLWGCP